MEKRYLKNRIMWIDVLKGIGVFFVVLGHVVRNDMIFSWIYSFHMPLFFFAAGYVYKQCPVITNVKHKLYSVMTPYFIFGTIIIIYWYLIERHARGNQQSLGEAIFGLVSGEYRYLDFNVHLWFLPCFFLTVVIYNILVVKFSRKWAIAIAVVMMLLHSFFEFPELVWGFDKVFQYIVFYSMGNLASNLKIDEKVRGNKGLVPIIVIVAVAGVILSVNGLNVGIIWFLVAVFGIFPWLVCSININTNKVLEYIGKSSLVVLCIHGPIYRILIKVFSFVFSQTTEDIRKNAVFVLIIVALTLLVCGICYKVILRWCPYVLGTNRKY